MTSKQMVKRITLIVAVAMILAALVAVAGCSSSEPVTKPEGMYSCVECHTDRELLKADLAANPLPEKVVAESEGEG